MASIRERPRANGTTAYTILYREDGRQRSRTFSTRSLAEVFLHRLESAQARRKYLEAINALLD